MLNQLEKLLNKILRIHPLDSFPTHTLCTGHPERLATTTFFSYLNFMNGRIIADTHSELTPSVE